MTFAAPRRPPGGPGLEELAADARYHRRRYDLYRAKAYSGRPTSETRLREYERACASAERRLASAHDKPVQP